MMKYPLLLFLTCLLTGCVSVFSAGPLGYDSHAIPIAVPQQSSRASEIWMTAHLSTVGSIFYTDDYAANAQAALQSAFTVLPIESLGLSLGLAAQGNYGMVHLRQNLQEAVDQAYWGGTGQIQPALSYFSLDRSWNLSLGLIFSLSWEDGPYAQFRKQVSQSDYGLGWIIDASPTPWSLSQGLWLEFSNQQTGLRFTTLQLFPRAEDWSFFRTQTSRASRVFVDFRFEGWMRYHDYRFMLGWNTMSFLNAGITLSLAKKL